MNKNALYVHNCMKQKFSTETHSHLHTCLTCYSTRSVRLYHTFITSIV